MRKRGPGPVKRGPKAEGGARIAMGVLAGCIFLAGSGCESSGHPEDVGPWRVTVPEKWTVERKSEKGYSQIVLRPKTPLVLCQIVSGATSDTGKSAPEKFRQKVKSRFGGEVAREITLRTEGAGKLPGIELRDVKMPQKMKALASKARIQVYADTRDGGMLAVIAGWFGDDAKTREVRNQCFDALASIRKAKGE